MQMLTRRKRNIEVARIIDDAITDYYSSLGLPVPNWKTKKDPEWWTRYLIDLGIEPRNP